MATRIFHEYWLRNVIIIADLHKYTRLSKRGTQTGEFQDQSRELDSY